MKIIEPSVELVFQNRERYEDYADICNKIERAGRVCYQSEPKGNPEDFIRRLIKRGHESVLEHASLTFHIICDRAIQNELVRHRLASFSVESTRYVKYDELTFIKPDFALDSSEHIWRAYIENCEIFYSEFIKSGEKPEITRGLLPLCLKSEMYMTANIREWRHILKLRTDSKAHPQMRFVAGLILDIFKKNYPVFVEDFPS